MASFCQCQHVQRKKHPDRGAFFVLRRRYSRAESRFLALRARKPVRFCREAVWELAHKRWACKFSPKANEGWRLQDALTKKMPTEKTEIFSGFLRFSPFSSLFWNSDFSENKKMPNGIFEQGSRSEPLPCLFRGDICGFWANISPRCFYSSLCIDLI